MKTNSFSQEGLHMITLQLIAMTNCASVSRYVYLGHIVFDSNRPKPAYGRQGLYWDPRARIQFGQVQFGAKISRHQQGDPTDLLW